MKVALARWQINALPPEDTPQVAWDALEQGFDGPALRRLAALDRPISSDIRELFPKAMLEAGVGAFARHHACVLVAQDRARKALAGEIPVEDAVRMIARTFYQEDHPPELAGVCSADDDIDRTKYGLISKREATANARKELQALLDQK